MARYILVGRRRRRGGGGGGTAAAGGIAKDAPNLEEKEAMFALRREPAKPMAVEYLQKNGEVWYSKIHTAKLL
jgi:hypothetical protein